MLQTDVGTEVFLKVKQYHALSRHPILLDRPVVTQKITEDMQEIWIQENQIQDQVWLVEDYTSERLENEKRYLAFSKGYLRHTDSTASLMNM